MFYKIKALAETGHHIILHYFDYNPMRGTKEIEPYCTAIYAYPRKNIFQSLPLSKPFIVQSRISRQLIQRLNEDGQPILLEGLHCSGVVPFLHQPHRVIIRMHNEEASYYHHLAQTERTYLKKKYFLQESRLLKRYQETFDKAIKLACLSETDREVFTKQYGFQQAAFIPCFIPWQNVNSKAGKGDYCLYHGNMTVSENEEAALWLIRQVFSQAEVPLVIAGKGISPKLLSLGRNFPHIRFITNPSIEEINTLVQEAQIHVLPSMNRTGVKLKLLHALLNGRFCITNEHGVMGSRITKGVQVCNESTEWTRRIQELMLTAFTSTHIEERKEILSLYHNQENARRLSAIWSHCQ